MMVYADLDGNRVIGIGEPAAMTGQLRAHFASSICRRASYTVRMVPHPGRAHDLSTVV